MTQINPMEIYAYARQGGVEGREEAKRSRLASLLGQAYGAPQEQRSKLLGEAVGIDPGAASQFHQFLGGMDNDRRAQIARQAQVFDALPEEQKAAAYPQLAREVGAMTGMPIPEQYDPKFLPAIQRIAGVSQGDGYTLAPGGMRFDANNNLVASAPFAPANGQVVNVPDGQGGSLQMIYDPRTGQFSQPNYGGAPAPTGGAAQVMGNALQDAVGSIISPLGGRITSTTGGKHNPGSKHYSGNAIDVGMGRESPEQQAAILAALQADPSLVVRDERTRPPGQAVWGGPHLHVERGQPGAPRLGYTPPKPTASDGGGKGSDYQLVTMPDGSVMRVNKVTGVASPVEGVTNYTATSQREEQKQIAALRAKLPDMRNMRQMLHDVDAGIESGKYSTGWENTLIPDALQSAENQELQTTINEQIVEMAEGMKGALSDKDVAFLRSGNISLDKKEEANRAILKRKLKILDEAIKRAEQRTGAAPAAPAAPASDIDSLLEKYR